MSILRGIVRVARFRVEGLAEFDASRNGFFNSIAPLVAFPLVGSLLELGQGSAIDALTDLLASVVALLVPLVISEILATRWNVGENWLGYAVAANWSQWILPMAMAAMLAAFWVMRAFGITTTQPMLVGAVVGMLIYGLALHWFLARRALGLSRGRSFLLVSICDLATLAMVMGPRLVEMQFNPG